MKGTLIAVAILFSGSDAAASEPRPSPPHLSAQDQRFMQRAAANNLAQIGLGQIAVQQGKTQHLRDFGQKIIDDHAKAADRLQQIATRAGVSLPTDLSDDQKATQDRLWSKSGRDFERAYLNEVKTSQRQAIFAFRREAKRGRDPELKLFAKSTLGTLRQHQQLASRTSQKM
jgi:putative membrane protein